MFRKVLLVLGLLLLSCSSSFAQSTTVSGTITDAGSQTWNNGTFNFVFVPSAVNPVGPYTWTGGAIPANIGGSLSGTGTYSVSIPSNSAISPIQTTWTATFCPQASSGCFTVSNITITGATQTLNATPPAILINLSQATPPVLAYTDSEITGAALGSQYFNLVSVGLKTCTAISGNNCTTWTAGGSATNATNLVGPGSITGSFSGTHTESGVVTFSNASSTFAGNAVTATTAGNLTGNCKQIEGTLCIDNANTQGWTGSDFGARLNSAIATLPVAVSSGGHTYPSGVIWIKNDNYVMTTAVTLGPFITLRCESGATIDYQGTGIPFLATTNAFGSFTQGFNYEATGGIENCRLTNSTANWSAGIKLQDINFFRIWNTNIAAGSTNFPCVIFDSHGAGQYSEQTQILHGSFAFCNPTVQFQQTGGTGSFAYTKIYGMELSPSSTGGVGLLLLNNSKLNESTIDANIFLPQSGIGLSFQGTSSAFGLRGLNLAYEFQVGATVGTGIKTITGTSLQSVFNEVSASAAVTDSIAAGTLIPYISNYQLAGLSQIQATAAGFVLNPNGTAAGYVCAASCGAMNYDNGDQTAGTFPHVQPPRNIGNNTGTMALWAIGPSIVSNLSGASSNYFALEFGRTAVEHHFVDDAAAGGFFTNALAGDFVFRTDNTANCQRFGQGNGSAAAQFNVCNTSVQTNVGFTPITAGTGDLGATALPFGNLWIGTAATNNFKFQPSATAAARIIQIADPGATSGLLLGGTNLTFSPTAPTIAAGGCGGTVASISAPNGTASFNIFTGAAPTSGGCTITMPTATTDWHCEANHVSAISTTNFIIQQTGALSTTSVTLQLFSDVAAATAPVASDTWRTTCTAN